MPQKLAAKGIDAIVAWQVPMRVKFRRIWLREGIWLHGPAGWGECSPFWDYDAVESAHWLAAGLETATLELPLPQLNAIPLNVTVPVVPPERAAEIVAKSGASTAKVKVADPGSDLAADVQRLAAVREAIGDTGKIRIDANAAWDVSQAVSAIGILNQAAGGLDYVEQPCPSVAELAEVKQKVGVRIAADESVRRAEDPLAVAKAGAADLLVIKVQPLGGIRQALHICEAAQLPVVVSSALDAAYGIWAGGRLAEQLALKGQLDGACGLGTMSLFTEDVLGQANPSDGAHLSTQKPDFDPIYHPSENGPEQVRHELRERWATRLAAMSQALPERRFGKP
ncbi:O-succinylbenzoate synthase [Boudabousia tangfeifanii]|uniref:o-succinylbenzoate synthase n=1 Tax=Boudabousia tangfeifanii TaxID=1912795 RepID=A0A1D9MMW5_9ACTO|nr:O-succinylbenzoate synthase [Boudabousia tangfeifanii]